MEKSAVELLGPWPILQFVLGLGILGFGVFMVVRGIQKQEGTPRIENRHQELRAYERLENIEENSFKQVELLARILDRMNNNADQLKALAAAIWNRKEGL